MPILGAHMSIAGGYYRAVQRARESGCDCVQIFTKNNNQWRAKPIKEEESSEFRKTMRDLKIKHPLAHASYLINLASPDAALRKKSIEGMVVELERADKLGIRYVVVHPGSFTTSDEDTGIEHVCNSLNAVHRQTANLNSRILLENTAGQGSNLGWRFEQLARMIKGTEKPQRLGVCFDTCHAFAAGYPLAPESMYEDTMRALKRAVGFRRVKAFHLNDSKQPFGSRRDRHEHIGRGEMGLDPFRILLNDPRWAKTPMYLETPKGTEDGQELDAMNLQVLRKLVAE